ncbi:hypothetical protein ACQ3I4_05815 [Zafaria sp. Z1313]|nr:hypothetical protein [Zafaria sp. J156]MEE1622500.1 hypothetical protein [Zafaria sp. J156]
MLGYFTSRELAERAVANRRTEPGFRDYPDDFEIVQVTLDSIIDPPIRMS